MDKVKELLSKKWVTAIIVSALLIFTFVSPLFSEKENNMEEQQTEQTAETEETSENQGFKLKIGKSDIILLVICLGSFGGIKLKQMYDEKLKQK